MNNSTEAAREVATVETVSPTPPAIQGEVDQAEVMVYEAKLTTARAQMLRAQADELAAAVTIARALTKSTSINPEFQAATIPRNQSEPLGEQAIYNLAVAIVYGSKLGWSPEEAAMRVFSVHGKPSIEAKDMLGFVRSFIDKRIAAGQTATGDKGGDDIWPEEEDAEHAVWKSRRNGHEVTVEWTMARATLAGYTARSRYSPNVPSKYETNPIEMLRWKCVAELCRMQWSDVLRGVQYSKEELEQEARKVITEHRPVKRAPGEAKGIEGLREHRAAMTAAQAAHSPEPTVIDGEAEPQQPESQPEPEQQAEPGEPMPVNEAGERLADREALKQIRDAYRKRKLSGAAMMGDLTQLLQRESPLHNLDELTADEATDALRLLAAPAE